MYGTAAPLSIVERYFATLLCQRYSEGGPAFAFLSRTAALHLADLGTAKVAPKLLDLVGVQGGLASNPWGVEQVPDAPVGLHQEPLGAPFGIFDGPRHDDGHLPGGLDGRLFGGRLVAPSTGEEKGEHPREAPTKASGRRPRVGTFRGPRGIACSSSNRPHCFRAWSQARVADLQTQGLRRARLSTQADRCFWVLETAVRILETRCQSSAGGSAKRWCGGITPAMRWRRWRLRLATLA